MGVAGGSIGGCGCTSGTGSETCRHQLSPHLVNNIRRPCFDSRLCICRSPSVSIPLHCIACSHSPSTTHRTRTTCVPHRTVTTTTALARQQPIGSIATHRHQPLRHCIASRSLDILPPPSAPTPAHRRAFQVFLATLQHPYTSFRLQRRRRGESVAVRDSSLEGQGFEWVSRPFAAPPRGFLCACKERPVD